MILKKLAADKVIFRSVGEADSAMEMLWKAVWTLTHFETTCFGNLFGYAIDVQQNSGREYQKIGNFDVDVIKFTSKVKYRKWLE
jgi:hypothetical protein